MPELNNEQLEAIAVDYDDMARTLGTLVRLYTAVAKDRPADRELVKLLGELRQKAKAYRDAAVRLRVMKSGAS